MTSAYLYLNAAIYLLLPCGARWHPRAPPRPSATHR